MKGDSKSCLRPYQAEAQRAIVEAWDSGARSVMLQMPTGAGKTRLFVNLIHSLSAGNGEACEAPRFLIVTHREELVEQVSETLTGHYRLEHGILQGKNTRDTHRRIIVASIQSLVSLFKSNAVSLPLWGDAGGEVYIIIDEAHHSLADTYRELWRRYPLARKLGVTATPYRLRKSAFTELYSALLESWPMRRMMEEGYLANYRLLSVSESRAAVRRINRLTRFGADGDYKQKDLHDILARDEEIGFLFDCYSQYAAGRKGIVYAVNREHAARIAERFAAEGVAAVAVDSRTRAKERRRSIEDFRRGKLQVLVNVELFTEGFDCPSIEFVMLARPTRSLTMYMQQVGRALRPMGSPSEADAVLILDCAGLRHRFGLPDRGRDWQTHFRGERPAVEQYEKRSLGEQEHFPLLREIRREERKYKPKPEREILPSDTGVHVFVDNARGVYGTCDAAGNTIEAALYQEIHRTPYGWYQGMYKELGYYFPVIFNKRGEKCLMCSSLRRVEPDVYEAIWKNRAIRFNLQLRIIPQETLVANGITVYQISHNAPRLYSASLELGGMMTFRQTPWGEDYVLLNNGAQHWSGLLLGRNGERHELAGSQGVTAAGGVRFVALKDGRMIGDNGEVRRRS